MHVISSASRLVNLMRVEPVSADQFVGQSESIGTPNLYGGQVLAQALAAAAGTIAAAGRTAHSLHAYFLQPGQHSNVEYVVQRLRDGKSFSNRLVTASQANRVIFEMLASFHDEEIGVEHQVAMPAVPGPEGLPSEASQHAAILSELPAELQSIRAEPIGIEYRRVQAYDRLNPEPYSGSNSIWIKATELLPEDPNLHRALLAYASDHSLLLAAIVRHGLSYLRGQVRPASIDHAMWFHRPFSLNDWILYSVDSPSSSGARALCRGMFYSRDGQLIASTAQEGLLRLPSMHAK